MKCIGIVIALFFVSDCTAFAQNEVGKVLEWQKRVGDRWFNERVDSMLKIGEKVPDIFYKKNYWGVEKKLVVLDFWTTGCTTCIAIWPELERLQRKYSNDIQIILMNTSETQQQVSDRFNKRYGKANAPKFPELPSIIYPELQSQFPIRGVPQHVWVDRAGIIRLIGPHYNTYEKKIEQFIKGDEIRGMKGVNNTPSFNETNEPYYKLLDRSIDSEKYNSFFSAYNENYSAQTSGVGENIIDSGTRTIRNTYINVDALDLYKAVFKEVLMENYRNPRLIYSRHIYNLPFLDYFLLPAIDTEKYTTGFVISDNLLVTDTEFAASKYCYEQVTPLSMNRQRRNENMLMDINKHFGEVLHAVGSLQKIKTPCLELVRTANRNRSNHGNHEITKLAYKIVFTKSKKEMIKWTGKQSDLPQMIRATIGFSRVSSAFNVAESGIPLFLFNNLNIEGEDTNKPIELFLPIKDGLTSIKDLKRALNKYDLDIVNGYEEVEFVVIKKLNRPN